MWSLGQALIDRQLYLPENWARDAERRAKAHVGALLGFKPKPKQAAFAARAFRCLPKSRALPRQQIRDPRLEKGGICRIGARIARAMTPHAWDRPQGPGCKMGKLGRIIRNAEIEIRLARHQEHLRLYGLERLREIAVVKSVVANITVKPSECLRIEVRRAALRKPLGPIGADEGFEIWCAKRAFVEAGTVEILAQTPAGVNVAKSPKRQHRLARKATIAGMLGRGFERAQQAGQKNFVVIGCAGAAADDEGAFHHFGVERRPMIGLHAAHRKSING